VELSGGEVLIEALKEEGVEFIFGYPGGAVLHIYDALYEQNSVKHILVRHEQGATHAADGYARATGKPGVVLVTSGPGATNAVTGIATAFMDSIPMVIISGQVQSRFIGSDAFQEVDCIGITRPCVKHNFLVNSLESFADTVKKAFHVATTGRPGPVVVDIPKDFTTPGVTVPFHYPKSVEMRSYTPAVEGHPGQIRKAVDLILSGTYEANMGMHDCDVLIAIGARFDDRVTGELESFCPHAKIVHIDIDPASISKTVKVDVPIVGNVGQVLNEMIKLIEATDKRADTSSLDDWWTQIRGWQSKDCLAYEKSNEVIKPQSVLEAVWRVTKGDAYVTSDVGQHQMWVADGLTLVG